MDFKLSIGVRWALRYTIAMGVTLTVFALVVESAVSRRINRQARLLLEIQAHELLESLRTQSEEHAEAEVLAWLAERAEHSVRDADRKLDLGIEYLDASGEPRIRAGSLARTRVPLPLDLLQGERPASLRAVNLGGEYAYLLSVSRAPGGFLQVAIDTRRFAQNVEHVQEVLLLSFPVMLLLTGGLGWLLARGSLRPVAAIARTARRVSGANLRELVPTTGSGDELDELAHTLNEMIERIREGVDRMHRFNSNAAHEMRTPLNAICSQIEVTLEKARGEDEYRKVLEEVLGRARQLGEGVNAMLRLSRSEAGLEPGHVAPVPVAPLLATLLEFFAPVAADRGLALEAGRFPEASVRGDPAWLRQLFSNLLDNAIKYCAAGDRILLSARRRGDWLEVGVADDGPGIPADRIGDIFDRFQRGAAHPGQPGFGLGLPLAREIARAHGGRIDVESGLGHGTRFTVRLPLASATG